MKNKPIIIGVFVAILAVIVISVSSFSGSQDVDTSRTIGTVNTSMGSPLLGSTSAKITIVEFGDFQCHQCYNWFHNTRPQIYENYIKTGKANLVFVDLAFLGMDSPKAAQAAYCAEDQGKYWQYHDILYNSQEPQIDGGWANNERLKAFAFSLDLDMDLFNSCLDSGKYQKRVQFNIGQAKSNGATGTPTFIIVGDEKQQKLSGAQPYDAFKNILDSMI